MTTIFHKQVNCYCCHSENTVRIIGSTNSLGFSDLDFRPPEMARSTITILPQHCVRCNYTWYDLNDGYPMFNAIIESPAYKALFSRPELRLSNLFRAIIRLADITDNRQIQVTARQQCIWALDDEKASEEATEMRLSLQEFVEQTGYLFEFQIDDSSDSAPEHFQASTLLIRIDLLRRASAFDEALLLLKPFGVFSKEDKYIKEIGQFLNDIIRNKDSSRYTFADALGIVASKEADRLDPLSDYLIRNHGRLLLKSEWEALRAKKAGHHEKWWMTTDTKVQELLQHGKTGAAIKIEQRLKAEYGISVVCCPKCGSPLRTPKAKQCPNCGHTWRPTSPD